MANSRRLAAMCAAAAAATLTVSCIDLDIPTGEDLFPPSSFITSGTVEVSPDGPECSVFHADNGFDYHLFQGPRLTNDEYDQLFEDGTRSRLEIQVRRDLELRCGGIRGRNAEVIEVLEFIPAAQTG